MATTITGKPDKKVSSLKAPARQSGNRKMESSWTVPAAMTKSTYAKRATNLVVKWKMNIGSSTKTVEKTLATSKTSSVINLSSFTVGSTSYTRNSFYPNTKNKLTKVTISVAGKNSKGTGEAVTSSRSFEVPREPVVDEIEFDTSTGKCTTTVTTNAGADYKERYDTLYRVTVTNKNGTTGLPTSGVVVRSGANTYTAAEKALTGTEFTISYNVSGYASLTGNQYIKVLVEAWARGYAGDSSHGQKSTKAYYLAKPNKPTITSLDVTSTGSGGLLNLGIDTNATTEHPVDSVRLEYLANVEYSSASSIPANASWDDSGIEDDGDCDFLSIPITGLVPDRGKYTWVRVKSWRAHEGVLFTYSDYKNISQLYTAPATQTAEAIKIISVTAGDDAESAVVQLAWNASGSDDSTGTELTWSEDADTWKSTKEPEKYEFTWSDGSYTSGGTTYHDSAKIVIKGLTEGETYHIRARRYYEGETVTYGNYSNEVIFIPNGAPDTVVASCKQQIAEGEPLQVVWSFGSYNQQTTWKIEDSNGTIIANGEGSISGTQISWDKLVSKAEDGLLTFRVWVSTGSEEKASDWITVRIQDRPTITLTAPSTMTAQPYSFTVESSKLCDLIVLVTSQGISGQYPEGYKMQVNGDTIHSDVYSPLWEDGSATITLPEDLDFWDGGQYTLSVVAEDRETGLRTQTSEAEITVNWANKAVDPYDYIALTPLDYYNEGGDHIQAVQIKLTPPANCNETDVYDIYRIDGGKANLIGEGFPLSCTTVDELAPFGIDEELYYRVAIRTVDGDVEFADKPYTLESNTVRFDWQGGTLELPYGITIGDNYKKSVEFRQHMDGSVDGYWNQNIERGASYNSSIIKLIQPEEVNLARQLARYAGAVFVRTANGSAFTADVQVTDLSVKNKAVTAIAVDATEVGMTEEFMLPTPYEFEEEE